MLLGFVCVVVGGCLICCFRFGFVVVFATLLSLFGCFGIELFLFICWHCSGVCLSGCFVALDCFVGDCCLLH